MARRRFFVEEIHNQQAELTGDQAHHLRNVLRVEAGKKYEISDNERVYLAEITLATKNRVVFSVLKDLPAVPPPVRVHLYLSLVKFDRLELAIEKATELGVETIIPVIAGRSEKGLEKAAKKRQFRWRRIGLEASQQCRRVRVPEIAETVRFREAVMAETTHRFLLDEAGAPPLLSALPAERAPADEVALLIGPEGGWTDKEREQALGTCWIPVSLGPQILRTETAAIAAMGILASAWQV